MFLGKNNKIKWLRLGIATVLVAIIIGVTMAWFDKSLYIYLRQFDCSFFRMLSSLFSAWVWIIVCMVLIGIVYAKKVRTQGANIRNSNNYVNLWVVLRDIDEKTKNSYAFYVFWSVLTAGIVAKFLKIVIGRMRPVFFEALDITGFVPFTTDWAFNSMPSGHTVATFAGLVMLGMLVPRIKWATWTLATIVGILRCVIGAHWPTDVIFGAFIGMVFADFVMAYLRRKNMS